MQLARSDPDGWVERDPEPSPQRGLLLELIAYLQHRQHATSAMVAERARQAIQRDEAHVARLAGMVDRMGTVERKLSRLHEQVDELRTITDALRQPPALPSPNSHGLPDYQMPAAHRSSTALGVDSTTLASAEPPTTGQRDHSGSYLPESPEQAARTLLRVEGLSKEIGGTDILRDISFQVYEGEILGLIGPNGAGKTTLMECLAGMRPRTGGTFFIGDEAPAAWDPKDLLFYLPNNVLPYGELYTIEVLRFFGQLYEVDQRRWEQIVMHDLSLAPALGKRVSALSKGNMQRLLIALALMSPQPLLALDEPFDGLDLHQTQAMMGILRALRTHARTLLLCIHQLNDAERICDRFLLLSAGQLVGVGTLTELRAQTGLTTGSLEEIFRALT